MCLFSFLKKSSLEAFRSSVTFKEPPRFESQLLKRILFRLKQLNETDKIKSVFCMKAKLCKEFCFWFCDLEVLKDMFKRFSCVIHSLFIFVATKCTICHRSCITYIHTARVGSSKHTADIAVQKNNITPCLQPKYPQQPAG